MVSTGSAVDPEPYVVPLSPEQQQQQLVAGGAGTVAAGGANAMAMLLNPGPSTGVAAVVGVPLSGAEGPLAR